MRLAGGAAGLAAMLTIQACGSPAPRDIRYGEESCDYCHMTIMDPAFAAQLVTRQGKVYLFDDVGGLASFYRENRVPPGDVFGMWVNLFDHPDRRVPVDSAVFLRSTRLRSPMGSGIAAFASRAAADSVRLAAGGDLLRWDAVLRLPPLEEGSAE